MKRIALLMAFGFLLAQGCGQKLGTVQVEGNPTLTVTVDTTKLEAFFQIYCGQLLEAQGIASPAQSQLNACSDAMTANFLAQVEGNPVLPFPSPSPSH